MTSNTVTTNPGDLLRRAASLNQEASITCGIGPARAAYRTHFINLPPVGPFVFLELPSRDETWYDDREQTFDPGQSVTVSFPHDHNRCLFETVVADHHTTALDRHLPKDVIVLHQPLSVQVMQRRAYSRAQPPTETSIAVDFWNAQHPNDPSRIRPFDHADANALPHTERIRRGRLDDLSAGGVRLASGDAEGLSAGDVVTCCLQLTPDSEPIILNARLKHVYPTAGGRRTLGLQFLGLEDSTQGQCRLAQLANVVSRFQRSAEPR